MPDHPPLTYDEVGATAWDLPAGYRHVRRSAVLGHGRERFQEAAQQLMTWQLHRRAGLRVAASEPVAVLGAEVTSAVGLGPLRIKAPCRVVAVIDESDRRGFAYGTLPGHPERGEESFTIGLEEDGTVVLDIVAFSRPAAWWARLGAPISRLVQDRVTTRYLRALRD